MQPDWEIWIDMNISSAIAKWINDKVNWRAKSSYTLQLNGLNDLEIYPKAKEAGQVILLSKDSDLPTIIDQFGSPPKPIHLKTGNRSNKELWKLLKPVLPKAVCILTTGSVDKIEIV